MTYLLAQLWLCLLIAGLIGSVLGWILRGSCKRYIKAIEEIQDKYVELEREHSANRKKLGEFSKLAQQRNSLLTKVKKLDRVKHQNAKLSTHLMKMQLGIKKARGLYEKKHLKLKKVEEVLAFAKQSNQAKDATITRIKRESIVADNLLLKYQAQWKTKYHALQAQQEIDLKKAAGSIQTVLAKAEDKTTKLVEAEERLMAMDVLSTKNNELESEKKIAIDQLTLFKEQSKDYITNITNENEKYKMGVDLLKEDLEQLEERYDQRGDELDKIDVTLKDREQEIVNLKEKLEREQVVLESQNPEIYKVKDDVRRWVVPRVNLLSKHVTSSQVRVLHASEEPSVQEPSVKEPRPLERASSLPVISSQDQGQDHSIDVIYGVGKAYAERLEDQGVSSTQDLLAYFKKNSAKGSSEVIEKDLAHIINVEASEVKSWRIMADLLRLDGLTNEYAKSLELSGISSVKDLADKKVSNVLKKMTRAMQNERRIKRFPQDEEILDWITQAQLMPAIPVSLAEEQSLDKSSGVINSSSGSTLVTRLSKWKRVKKIMGKYRRK